MARDKNRAIIPLVGGQESAMKKPLLLLLPFALATSTAMASGTFMLAWRELRFTTESGDIVEISQKEGKEVLQSLRVCWNGWYFDLPRAAIEDVPSPLLNGVKLGYSSGFTRDGMLDHWLTLQLPVFSTDRDAPKRQYEFSFHDGKFVERHLEEEHGTLWKHIESVSFDLLGENVSALRPGPHGKLICRPPQD
jgi:hypothetical protein